jgi:hypothetical protein
MAESQETLPLDIMHSMKYLCVFGRIEVAVKDRGASLAIKHLGSAQGVIYPRTIGALSSSIKKTQ